MTQRETTAPAPARISQGMVMLFAIAGGAAVANLYWAQPLLEEIASSFRVSTGEAGLLVTTAQIGYALGVFLIVPLGDVVDRRRLLPLMMLVCAAALTAAAFAPSFQVLLLALVLVGLTTVSGPLLTPLAGDLADPAQRGHVIGTVASGLMIGVLASRTISGFLAELFGWRTPYAVAAVLALAFAVLLRKTIPPLEPRAKLGYGALLGSVLTALRRHPDVRVPLFVAGVGFGVLTLFWTALTFLLASPPFSFSVTTIGLFGLAGITGAIAAQRAGRFHDRGWSTRAISAALALTMLSFVVAGFGSASIIILVVAIILLDVAARAIATLAQARVLSADHDARSRLNTAYVVSNFIGGAAGSTLGTALWQLGGWTAVVIGGAVLSGIALAAWAVSGHRPSTRRASAVVS
ncbi:MFS transporter [Arthrobacter sp. SRS-W-1-2016]|uniref:MFS transporter n=1 Tax=Arthrobacter sp. SRS-W-1-2016 TaxID=1930254 RepID=UPI000990A492|nr:MFS transporter [Arthrobacter sp. SRS-W-1-2016]OOP60381.1 MFS transporter [Arthrobacter sp. SRS-W-1-2016]